MSVPPAVNELKRLKFFRRISLITLITLRLLRNATLAGLPVYLSNRLQSTVGAQRCSTSSLFGAEIRPRDITASRPSLASSTVANRLQARGVAVLTFRYLLGQAPSYLTDGLRRTGDVESRRSLQ